MRIDYTYETENTTSELETFEWDNPWWEQAPDTKKTRVLYIGDSISYGIRRHATEISENTLLFDNFSTSKALDNPYFADSLALFAKQERYRSVVLFNNGLHGFHLNDSLFERYYRKMIVYLKESFQNIPIMVVLSTTVGDTERRACIIRRNAIAQKIANENGLDVIDLFEASERMTELQTADLVHFNEEGFHALAKIVVDAVKTHLSAKVNK